MTQLAAALESNLSRVQVAIGEAAVRAGRAPEDITLIGVTKTQPADVAAAAVRAGLQHLAENRVQEAASKIPAVATLVEKNPPCWHLVGHLQTNKAAASLELFQAIDSVDSVRLAQALSKRVPPGRVVPVLLEVYVGDDPTRPGFRPDEVVDAAGEVIELPGLAVHGVMTVAPLGGDARAAFARVREVKNSLAVTYPGVHFSVLSMGMSDDFQAAIAEGSTQVRLGTAIFGARGSVA